VVDAAWVKMAEIDVNTTGRRWGARLVDLFYGRTTMCVAGQTVGVLLSGRVDVTPGANLPKRLLSSDSRTNLDSTSEVERLARSGNHTLSMELVELAWKPHHGRR
jgi:hypothetical protein